MTREIEWRDGWMHEIAARVAALEQWHRDATARPPEVGKVHGMMHSAPERATVQPQPPSATDPTGLVRGLREAVIIGAVYPPTDGALHVIARHVQSLIAAEGRRVAEEAARVCDASAKQWNDMGAHGNEPAHDRELAARIRALGDGT